MRQHPPSPIHVDLVKIDGVPRWPYLKVVYMDALITAHGQRREEDHVLVRHRIVRPQALTEGRQQLVIYGAMDLVCARISRRWVFRNC
jgi:hypothetical protein